MHTEPQKIICGIEECEYALHFWNCAIKLCKLPFTSSKALEISGGNYANTIELMRTISLDKH